MSDRTSFSVLLCMRELICHSLENRATSIAFRFSREYCRLQLVDNGLGFSKAQLVNMIESLKQSMDAHFYKINRSFQSNQGISRRILIITKCPNFEIYAKVSNKLKISQSRKIPERPIHGTTIDVLLLDKIEIDKSHHKHLRLMFLLFALNNPQVSFSLRDDDNNRLICGYGKLKISLELFKEAVNSKIPFLNSISKENWNMLRNIVDKGNQWNLFSYKFNKKDDCNKNEDCSMYFQNNQSSLCSISEKTSLGIDIIPNANYISMEECRRSQESNLCNAICEGKEATQLCQPIRKKSDVKSFDCFYNNFRKYSETLHHTYSFLPKKLNSLLQIPTTFLRRHPVTNLSSLGVPKKNNSTLKDWRIQMTNFISSEFICKPSKMKELTLDKKSLKNIMVLNQVNREFIAAVTSIGQKKLLILIDQHAMDERIRYGNLLRTYKDGNSNKLLALRLCQPIEISDLPVSIIDSLIVNKKNLHDFGIDLVRKNANTLIILTIPKCFAKRKAVIGIHERLKCFFIEMGEKFITGSITTTIPVTIHQAISSEACYGAIKFGDVLTADQCHTLISNWIVNGSSNRCAHGRPVMIPLLSFNSSVPEQSSK